LTLFLYQPDPNKKTLKQDNGQIPNFPRDKTVVICNRGDAVCSGSLAILPPHLDVGPLASEFETLALTRVLVYSEGAGSR